jgi:hypothetical protein
MLRVVPNHQAYNVEAPVKYHTLHSDPGMQVPGYQFDYPRASPFEVVPSQSSSPPS